MPYGLDRVIVVRASQHTEESYLERLFTFAQRPLSPALEDWDKRVDAWCHTYRSLNDSSFIVEIDLAPAIYLFDQVAERVVLAYGISVEQLHRRDANRMRGFPNVNIGIQAVLGENAFPADRGHFLGHASGGVLDINLFPHRRELNRGWSEEGKVFRAMEKFVATHTGVFFYHRPMYDDDSWIPARLEYGVLVDDDRWWIRQFRNK